MPPVSDSGFASSAVPAYVSGTHERNAPAGLGPDSPPPPRRWLRRDPGAAARVRLSLRWLALAVLGASALAVRADFDRLRITIASSSDWTILRLTGPERFVSSAGVVLAGTATFQTGADALQVNQPLSNAQAGVTVTVQFDLILQSSNPPAISFESTRGNLGRVRMDFYQFNSNAPVFVASVTNAVTTGHPNARPFSLPADALLAGDLSWTRPSLPPLVLAFYYPWYNYDSWASPTLRDYPRAPYHSDSNSVILRHVRQAKAAGIDGFISSWWGPNSQTDRNLARLLAIAEAEQFLVSIYFETLTGDPAHARDEAEILSWLRYFLQTYGNHPRLLRLEGKPVVFIWAAGAAPTDLWQRVFTTLRAEGLDAFYSANTLNTAYLAVFDGLHDYASAFRGTLEADFQQASAACRLYGVLEGRPQLKVWAATTQPGYDDVLIPGRAGSVIERLDGATYVRTWEGSLASAPDWVLITSFNEWWENTHIEPSVAYGSRYLALTGQYADRFKGFTPRPPADFAASVVSDPDGRLRLSWQAPFGQAPESYNLYRSSRPFTNIAGLTPLAAGLRATSFNDYPPQGTNYYAVTALFGDVEGPMSEVLACIVGTNKSRLAPGRLLPTDIALYVDSTAWITPSVARTVATQLVQNVSAQVSRIEILSAAQLPQWLLAHIGNGQLDVLITFGDVPDSIYPGGNTEPDRSLVEAFLDDGNLILNTGDYMFYAGGRNGSGGLMNLMDAPIRFASTSTTNRPTPDGARFTPSLREFVTSRPFPATNLAGKEWELEVAFADNGGGWADPAIVRHPGTSGRVGIVFQQNNDTLPRAAVLSEILTNWLPTVLPRHLTSATLVSTGSVWRYQASGANLGTAWRLPAFNDSSWPSGPGQLGFGDGDEATVIASNRQITTYFRHAFVLSNPAEVVSLQARLLRDDAAVVYLNGVEAWRDTNLPAGVTITYTTPALTALSGAQENLWLTNALDPAPLVPGTNLLAVEVHQSSSTSSDVSFDFALDAVFSTAPAVCVAAPAQGSSLPEGVITLAAAVTGPVVRVEFFAGGQPVGETSQQPYAVSWAGAPRGLHQVHARAMDTFGRYATSAPVQFTVLAVRPVTLVPAGAVWSYLDTGVDPGPAWTMLQFDDSAWRTGPAQLGYGDGDEATVVRYGPDPNNKHITTWFRHRFFVAGASAVQSLTAGLVRDDGAVVYLNGVEVWRDNMPAGPVDATTLAKSAIGGSAESAWLTKQLNPAGLVSGTNLLAVEIHQNTNTSSDISFDFTLTATLAVVPPALSLSLAGSIVSLAWPVTQPGLFRVWTATNLTPPILWTPLTNPPVLLDGTWRLLLPLPTNTSRFYRLATE